MKNKVKIYEKTIHLIEKSRDYNDYFKNVKRENFSSEEKGFVQEIFAMLYFKIHHIEHNVDKYISNVWLKPGDKEMKRELNLPLEDKGTDAIIIHKNGKVSLVQVKWRTKDSAPTRDQYGGMSIDFHGLPQDKRHFMYFFTNVHKEGDVPNNIYKHILFSDLMNIEWDFFSQNAVNFLNGSPKTMKIADINLRPWQIKADKFCRDKEKATVVAACGAGKTVFAYTQIMKSYSNVIMVPTLQLLSQWFSCLAKRLQNTKYILVGSDLDDHDIPIPYELTTDSDVLRQEIDDCEKGRLVILSTYQSFPILGDVLGEDSVFYDLFIDEAHLTVSSGKYGRALKMKWNKQISLTATTKIIKGWREEKINSMDDEKMYGPQFHYVLRKAIDDGILSDYNIVMGLESLVDPSEADKIKLYAKFLKKCIDKYGLKKILVASNTHASSRKLYNEFVEIYDGKCILMPPNAKPCHKSRALEKLENSSCVVFNVRVFNLGTDIRPLEAVFFNGDKKSAIDIVQTSMRCTRSHVDKKLAYILIPAIIGNDIDDEMCDFPNIRNILSALGNSDSAICEEMALRMPGIEKEKISVDKFRLQFMSMGKDVDNSDIVLNVFDRFGNRSAFEWMAVFNLVKEFCMENGRCPKYVEKYRGKNVGAWCDTQRQNYKKGKLDTERVEKLESIEEWKWDIRDERWTEMWSLVKEFCMENGRCPKQVEKYRGVNVGKWCSDQKYNYKNKNLDTERVEKLESIEEWKWDVQDERWTEMWSLVEEFCMENGRCPMNKEKYRGKGVGLWCNTQRYNYKNKNLDTERVEKFESIKGWKWDVHDERWTVMWSLVKDFCMEKGRCPTRGEKCRGKNIGVWCNNQRKIYKEGKLDKGRADKLESIEVWKWYSTRQLNTKIMVNE